MNKPAAIAAQLVDVRNVGQHKCVKLTIHVPAEQAGLVMEAFGWPTMIEPVPVALARLNPDKITSGESAPVDGEAAGPSTLAVSFEPTASASRRGEPSLRKPVAPEHRLAQRAAMLCNEELFWKFLNETSPALPKGSAVRSGPDAAYVLRAACGVASRADIIPGSAAAEKFDSLYSQYILWRDVPEMAS